MKKYLFNGAMALIVGGFIVSCSHDDISQPATVDQMTKSFDEMFTELYGPIAPNHNWGFETVAAEPAKVNEEEIEEEVEEEVVEEIEVEEEKASTRSAERASTRAEDPDVSGTITYAYDAKYRKDYYLDIFKNLPEDGKSFEFESTGTIEFNILYAYTSTHDQIGIYYYHPSTTRMTGSQKKEFLGDLQNIGQRVKVTVTEGFSDWTGLLWFGMSPDDGEDAWTRRRLPNQAATSRTITIKAPAGYRVGFYVKQGNNPYMYSNQALNDLSDTRARGNRYYATYLDKGNNTYVVGLEDQFISSNKTADYRNVLIEVRGAAVKNISNATPPAYKETFSTRTDTYRKIVDQGRIFVEDIATAAMHVTDDIDYNDIVFDARVWRIYDKTVSISNDGEKDKGEENVRYQYDIDLLATGGTIDAKINEEVDVHNIFGVGQAFMVNTWTPNCSKTLSGQWNTPTNLIQPKNYTYTLSYDKVDPNNVGINTIPIVLKYKNQPMEMENKVIDGKASAPYKLCLPVGTQWPIERVNIKDAYPKFVDYVSNPDIDFTNGQKGELLYQDPHSSIEDDGMVIGSDYDTKGEDTEPQNWTVVWKGNVTQSETYLELFDCNFDSVNTLRIFGTGSFDVSANNQNSFSCSISGGYCDITITNNIRAALKKILRITGSDFTLTKIVVF